MRVRATYRHVIEVTREVEVEDDTYQWWLERNGGDSASEESALIRFLNLEDTEFHAEVFRDWHTNEPMPADFELQWSEVVEAEPTDHSDGGER